MDSTSSPSILFYSLHFPRAVSRFGNADPRIGFGEPERAFLAEAERLPVRHQGGDGIVPAGALRGEARAGGAVGGAVPACPRPARPSPLVAARAAPCLPASSGSGSRPARGRGIRE